MVSYSEAPLLHKLGYKAGQTVLLHNAPDWFRHVLAEDRVATRVHVPADHAHFFLIARSDLPEFITHTLLEKIAGSLWLSWPKKTSNIATDLKEQDLRDYVLPLGWVDIKVASLDDIWSGLKFVRRRS